MDAPTTLVWIAPDPPEADQRRALGAWAAAHDTRLVDPEPWQPEPLATEPTEAAVAAEVEDALDRVRDALAGVEGATADAEIAKADARLRAHPELPQAAWLMAEVERARGVRWRRVPPVDVEAATRAWKRAEALDGGRAAAVGEVGIEGRPEAASVTLLATLDASEQVWLDGRPVGRLVDSVAGLHAVAVTAAGVPVWAEWREAPPGPSTLVLDPPSAPPCSRPDVASARVEGEAIAADPVRCGAWVAAMPVASAARAVRLAVCFANRCGPVVPWRLPDPWTAQPPAASTTARGWPAWATWSAVGLGAVVAGGAAIVLATSLRSQAAETRFVSGGLQNR